MPFHGRAVRGWVLGPTRDVPGRLLAVGKAVAPVRFFDDEGLALARWMSARYVSPLAAVLARMTPPRVASEEVLPTALPRPVGAVEPSSPALGDYADAAGLLACLRNPRAAAGAYLVRPAPDREVRDAVDLVASCLRSGRRAIVIVPEAAPVPATAAALVEAFGERVALFLGGSKRSRYRMWLDVRAGAYDVVVGTRPAVFAPVGDLGLVYVSRESHTSHREDRAPYYHVRDVAIDRARAAEAAGSASRGTKRSTTSGRASAVPSRTSARMR